MTGPWDLQPPKPLSSPGPSNYGAGADRKVDPRAVISPCVSSACLAGAESGCHRAPWGPWSLRGLQLPGRRVSTGPVFIIQRGLYFDLGARLIIAYNAQGETRHHLTVAADSLPAGWDASWALGREEEGVLSLAQGSRGPACSPRLPLSPRKVLASPAAPHTLPA